LFCIRNLNFESLILAKDLNVNLVNLMKILEWIVEDEERHKAVIGMIKEQAAKQERVQTAKG